MFTKYELWIREVHFIGHVVAIKGNHVDPANIGATWKWEVLKTLI